MQLLTFLTIRADTEREGCKYIIHLTPAAMTDNTSAQIQDGYKLTGNTLAWIQDRTEDGLT